MPARKRAGHRAGFTLIELLVVVVIIGILASVALPSFSDAQDKARDAKAMANVNVVRLALENYGAENNGVFPDNAVFPAALAPHLPGGKLPLSPWCSATQTVRIMPAIDPVVCMENYTADPNLRRPKNFTSFTPVTAGTLSNPPASMTDFGAIANDCDDAGDRTRYVLYVLGKKGKQVIVAGSASNFGM